MGEGISAEGRMAGEIAVAVRLFVSYAVRFHCLDRMQLASFLEASVAELEPDTLPLARLASVLIAAIRSDEDPPRGPVQ
jgi:hypothetical protein